MRIGRSTVTAGEFVQLPMNTKNVKFATVPNCAECGEHWFPWSVERWRAEFIDDGLDDVLRFWCPSCWEREFGGL